MPDISFGAGATSVAAETETAAQVPATTKAGAVGPSVGEWLPTFADIILERINISQNIGKLKESFPPGSVVYGRNTGIYVPADIDLATGTVKRPATKPVVLTVLGFRRPKFVEKTVGGMRGLTVLTEEAVTASGGTLDYQEYELKKKDGIKLFQPFADAMIAIRRPDHIADDDKIFTFAVEGHKYAVAFWGMKGTSYTNAAKRVFFTHKATGCLQPGWPTFNYSLITRAEKYEGGKEAHIPVCTPLEKNTPAFLEFVGRIIPQPAKPV